MKPNDDNAGLPTGQRPFRVLLLSGSQRRQYNCPGVDGKSRSLMMHMAQRLPQDWEIDYEDLANVFGRKRIQPCNACVSTSMALCVWPCNCYEKNSFSEPDLMWDMDLYARLDMADAWAIIGPINWYGPSTNLKAMFDRLVCMNGGNPDENLIAHKDPEKAIALEHSEQWEHLSVNHLEGRTAAFFVYGDEGGDEMGEDDRPKILRHKHYFNPEEEPFQNERDAYAPLVWQCRYGGVEVPDPLWVHCTSGKGKKYSENQAEHMILENAFMKTFHRWVDDFAEFVGRKGKVEPGKWRAYGLQRKTNLWQEAQTGLRDWKLRVGWAPENSSNKKQINLDLNKDVTLHPKQSEGAKLRRKEITGEPNQTCMPTKEALLIFVRRPVLGKVKTRLAAAIGAENALLIYRKLLEHTHAITAGLPVDKFVFYADAVDNHDLWQPGYRKERQAGTDLGERMKNAFDFLFQKGYRKAGIIGSDCFELTPDIISLAFQRLTENDFVIGPAADGGYYLLAMKECTKPLFDGIAWSTGDVLAQTLEKIAEKGYTVALLPLLNDVDTVADVPPDLHL